MSQPGSSAQRNLSLTEELERLEQSITLTLQEIDSNFSKAHRIVTTSILPLVEQYGEHSRSVWEATKFWKQFFEASANVSLSGYEELAEDEEHTLATDTQETSTIHDGTTIATDAPSVADYTPRPHASGRSDDATITADQSSAFPSRQQHRRSGPDYSLLSDGDGDLTGSTPRPPATKTLAAADLTTALPCGTMVLSKPKFADLQTPYEVLKRELKSEADMPDGSPSAEDEEEEDMEVLSQRHTSRLPRMSMTPRGSLAGGEELGYEDDEDVTQGGTCGAQKTKDRLLHRVLDKNYRLLATPHKGIATGVSPLKWKVTAKDDGDGKGKGKEMERPAWQDSPMSSPEMAVPQLRSAAFLSPVRAAYRTNKIAAAEAAGKAPRTPGVSVQTPAGGKKMKDVYQPYKPAAAAEGSRKYLEEISWESDSDEEALRGMSPPKTIQFALLPAKLMQTPAREASKRIVDDILLTAGAELDETSDYSPTVVKMNPDILDDTF